MLWRSVGLWILQRITAVLLVAFLGVHVWASNFSTNWAAILRAMIDISLLGLALFHGLNGVRTVILDFNLGLQGRRYLSVSLVMLGFTAFLFGVFGLWPLFFAK
jgi:succinate dehydrogenase / fumarate reductase membrane anchor subunit